MCRPIPYIGFCIRYTIRPVAARSGSGHRSRSGKDEVTDAQLPPAHRCLHPLNAFVTFGGLSQVRSVASSRRSCMPNGLWITAAADFEAVVAARGGYAGRPPAGIASVRTGALGLKSASTSSFGS